MLHTPKRYKQLHTRLKERSLRALTAMAKGLFNNLQRTSQWFCLGWQSIFRDIITSSRLFNYDVVKQTGNHP